VEYRCSPEDSRFLAQCKWRDTNGYLLGSRKPVAGQYMHRVVATRMGLNITGLCIDHIDRDKRNNTRENLRTATNQQNQANYKLSKANKSGYRGVFWSKATGKWQAQIVVNKKARYLGVFTEKEDAHEAYKEAARKVFGEFAAV
jgi:hypothetical protein